MVASQAKVVQQGVEGLRRRQKEKVAQVVVVVMITQMASRLIQISNQNKELVVEQWAWMRKQPCPLARVLRTWSSWVLAG
mmetsp:Transcript_367/g.568  ORF Transcript_367/g.568 Transcript_367/m.568 type:complete len:80 (+) Transcript_367:135-374(+)